MISARRPRYDASKATEKFDIVATLKTYIWEGPGSNVGCNIGSPA